MKDEKASDYFLREPERCDGEKNNLFPLTIKDSTNQRKIKNMKKDYKFRGRIINSESTPNLVGEWYYGFYYQDLDGGVLKHYIFSCPMVFEVDPETVGQFTGFLDKEGKKIWEGSKIQDRDEVLTVIWNSVLGCYDVEFEGGDIEPLVNEEGKGCENYEVIN